ncbi:MAG: hypothetical protein AB7G17_07680 [Phycisphaerales bacterium]
MKRIALPPIVERMTSGRWPYVWTALLSVFALMQWVIPPAVEAGEARAENEQERDLVRSYRTLASEEESERARYQGANEWWAAHAALRAKGGTTALTMADAQDRLRRILERPGSTVTKLEALPAEIVSETPRTGVARLTVQFAVERMEVLGEALGVIEAPRDGESAGWFRVGNMTVTRSAYSAITGVIVDATIYVWLEPGS